MRFEGFILGLSNGVACVAYCAPALIPFLLGEGKGIARNALLTGQFLLGRLLGYLLFAVLAWGIGRTFLIGSASRDLIIGAAYILFSILLVYYGFFRKEKACRTASPDTLESSRPQGTSLETEGSALPVLGGCGKSCSSGGYREYLSPALLPAAAGFATGLSFCPPFLLAFTGAAAQPSLMASLLFFFSFFLGTSVLFVLIPFVGALSRFSVLQIVGKMAAGIMGLYYLYSGCILLVGGLKS